MNQEPVQDKTEWREEFEKLTEWMSVEEENVLKKFIEKLLSQKDAQIEERVGNAIDTTWKEMTDRTFDHTMKGRLHPFDVTKEDWDSASFTIDEFRAKVLSRLEAKDEKQV